MKRYIVSRGFRIGRVNPRLYMYTELFNERKNTELFNERKKCARDFTKPCVGVTRRRSHPQKALLWRIKKRREQKLSLFVGQFFFHPFCALCTGVPVLTDNIFSAMCEQAWMANPGVCALAETLREVPIDWQRLAYDYRDASRMVSKIVKQAAREERRCGVPTSDMHDPRFQYHIHSEHHLLNDLTRQDLENYHETVRSRRFGMQCRSGLVTARDARLVPWDHQCNACPQPRKHAHKILGDIGGWRAAYYRRNPRRTLDDPRYHAAQAAVVPPTDAERAYFLSGLLDHWS
jgi:hypothetical protein